MKFFTRENFKEIIQGYQSALKIYPLTLLASFVFATLSYVHWNFPDLYGAELSRPNFRPYLTLFGALIPWTFAAHVARNLKLKPHRGIAGLLFVVTLVAIAVLSLQESRLTEFTWYYQLVIVYGLAHLLVAVVFALGRDEKFFWDSNILVLHRFVFATLAAGIFAVGLLALAQLFNVLIFDLVPMGRLYPFIYHYGFMFLHSWIFLSGCDFNAIAETTEVQDLATHKYLKNLLQYVNIPLVALYGTVLVAYLLKIIFQWNLPKGLVSYYVIALAVLGIATYLLSIRFALAARSSEVFRAFRRYFFWLLLPMLALLWVGVMRRLVDYGLSPDRYLLLVTTLWLTFITLLYVLRPRTSLVSIPASLWTILALLAVSPLAVYKFPVEIMHRNVQRHLAEAAVGADAKLARHVSSSVAEIYKFRGKEWVASHYGVSGAQALSLESILKALRLPEATAKETANDRKYVYCVSLRPRVIKDLGRVELIIPSVDLTENKVENKQIFSRMDVQGDNLEISFAKDLGSVKGLLNRSLLNELAKNCDRAKGLGDEYLEIRSPGDKRILFYPLEIRGMVTGDSFQPSTLSGSLVFRKK